jgi:hypothetical protein
MRSEGTQLDLMRHAPAELARACRVAAETALINPYESQADRQARAAAYLAEAARLGQLEQHRG